MKSQTRRHASRIKDLPLISFGSPRKPEYIAQLYGPDEERVGTLRLYDAPKELITSNSTGDSFEPRLRIFRRVARRARIARYDLVAYLDFPSFRRHPVPPIKR